MPVLSIVLMICAVGCGVIGAAAQYYLGGGTTGTRTEGTILGYSVEDYSSRVRPMVEFEAEGQTVRTVATNIPDKGKPEIGSRVTLIYTKNEFSSGRVTWQAALAAENGESRGNSLQGIAVLMWVLAAALLIAGITIAILVSRGLIQIPE